MAFSDVTAPDTTRVVVGPAIIAAEGVVVPASTVAHAHHAITQQDSTEKRLVILFWVLPPPESTYQWP